MIGIIGIYYNVRNFGAQLQARALQVAIKSMGYPCVWIRYDYKTGIFNPFVSNNINSELDGDENIFWKKYADSVEPELKKRRKAFDEFQNQTPHTNLEYNTLSLPAVMKECDRLMIGGDHVWNDFYFMAVPHMVDNFTLSFVPEDWKTFSFAASTGGGAELSLLQQERLKPGLKKLKLISCREKSSVPLLERLSGKSVSCVLDSTFLLQKYQWVKIRNNAQSVSNQKFAVCLLMGGAVEWREACNSICHKCNVQILCFPHLGESRYYKVDYSFGDIRDFTSGPAEFLDLIEKSEFVITDSFHACVFSIIYNKPFYVFLRDESKRNLKTNARIEDLLDDLNISDRIVTPHDLSSIDQIEPVNYEKVNKIVAEKREESLAFLRQALEMEND